MEYEYRTQEHEMWLGEVSDEKPSQEEIASNTPEEEYEDFYADYDFPCGY